MKVFEYVVVNLSEDGNSGEVSDNGFVVAKDENHARLLIGNLLSSEQVTLSTIYIRPF